MADYDVQASEVVWEGKLSTARVDQVQMPDGQTTAREVVAHLDAVAIVALTADDEIVLLRQYRHPLEDYQLEIPAGLLDVQGESEEDAAIRELAEETGMVVPRMERVLRFANSGGWTDEHTTVFLGRGAQSGNRPANFSAVDEEADMALVTIPFGEAVDLARSGRIADAKTLIGILAVAALGFPEI